MEKHPVWLKKPSVTKRGLILAFTILIVVLVIGFILGAATSVHLISTK